MTENTRSPELQENDKQLAADLVEEIPDLSPDLALKVCESKWLRNGLQTALNEGERRGLEFGLRLGGAPAGAGNLVYALASSADVNLVFEDAGDDRLAVELDWVREEAPESAEAFAQRHGLEVETVTENGPAGGAAILRFIGYQNNLATAVIDYTEGDSEQAQWFMDQAVPYQEPSDV